MKFLKHFCFTVIILSLSNFCRSQSTTDSIFKKSFSVLVNPVRMAFDDLGLYAEFHIAKRFGFGVGGGKIYCNKHFNFLTWDHDSWPGPIFDGYEFMTSLKYYFSKNNRIFFSFQYQYVNKLYPRQLFHDQDGDSGDRYIEIKEKKTINTFSLLFGKEFRRGHLTINLFWGISQSQVIRKFTNYSSVIYGMTFNIGNIPIGTYTNFTTYALPCLGLKLGFCSDYSPYNKCPSKKIMRK